MRCVRPTLSAKNHYLRKHSWCSLSSQVPDAISAIFLPIPPAFPLLKTAIAIPCWVSFYSYRPVILPALNRSLQIPRVLPDGDSKKVVARQRPIEARDFQDRSRDMDKIHVQSFEQH